MNYPAALDNGSSLPNPSGTNTQNNPDHAGLHTSENQAIIALEGKVGVGATTPATNTLLIGTGAGTSAWSQLTSAQLAAILTDETGSGANVFANTPVLITPKIDTITENTVGNGVTVGGVSLKNGVVTGSGAGLTAGSTPGSVLSANSVDASKVNWGATGAGAGIWWEELARATASSSVSSLTTATFTARKYLRIMSVVIPDAAVSSAKLRFNGDAGTNYAYRVANNGGADSTGSLDGLPVDSGSSLNAEFFFCADVINITNQEKIIIGNIIDRGSGNGAGLIPTRREGLGKWANATAQITQAGLVAVGFNITAGSEIIILGHN